MKKILACLVLFLFILSTAWSQQAMKIKARLNHIAIYLYDLKKSADFYSHIIGLDTIQEPFHDGRHSWFNVGDKSHLHVIQGAAPGISHEKNNHLCFSVASVESFISSLDKNNIPFEN